MRALPFVEAALSWAYGHGYWPGSTDDKLSPLRPAVEYANANMRRVLLEDSGSVVFLKFVSTAERMQVGDFVTYKDGRKGLIWAVGGAAYHARLDGPARDVVQGTAKDFTLRDPLA